MPHLSYEQLRRMQNEQEIKRLRSIIINGAARLATMLHDDRIEDGYANQIMEDVVLRMRDDLDTGARGKQ